MLLNHNHIVRTVLSTAQSINIPFTVIMKLYKHQYVCMYVYGTKIYTQIIKLYLVQFCTIIIHSLAVCHLLCRVSHGLSCVASFHVNE